MNHSHVLAADSGTRQNIGAQALLITGFAALTALGARIEIPHQPVPYTLQTLFVLLSGALLGKRNGALSQVLYILAGAIGMPVFAQGGFGVARLLGPTGGYLLSFPIAACIVGYLLDQRRSRGWTFLAMVVGLFVIFSLGTLQLYFIYFHDAARAFIGGFLIFSWWDVLKLLAAWTISSQLAGRLPKYRH